MEQHEVIIDLELVQELLEQQQDEHYTIYIDTLNLCIQLLRVQHLLDYNIFLYLDLEVELDRLALDEQHNELEDEHEVMVDLYDQCVIYLILLERYPLHEVIDEREEQVLDDEAEEMVGYSLECTIHYLMIVLKHLLDERDERDELLDSYQLELQELQEMLEKQ